MYYIVLFVLSFLFYEHTVFSATVDQRQTGDLNVQIDLKNLQIVGLMKGKEEYVEYDYAYDYSEMTIKPPNGTRTTKKPLNVTETATSENTTAAPATAMFAEFDQTSSTTDKYTETNITVTTTKTEWTESNPVMNATTSKPIDLLETTTVTSNSTSPSCKKGFFRNSLGSCQLKLQNPSNALLKMIRQKVKLNATNGIRQP